MFLKWQECIQNWRSGAEIGNTTGPTKMHSSSVGRILSVLQVCAVVSNLIWKLGNVQQGTGENQGLKIEHNCSYCIAVALLTLLDIPLIRMYSIVDQTT